MNELRKQKNVDIRFGFLNNENKRNRSPNVNNNKEIFIGI
jgi:hypothetical protein